MAKGNMYFITNFKHEATFRREIYDVTFWTRLEAAAADSLVNWQEGISEQLVAHRSPYFKIKIVIVHSSARAKFRQPI